MTKAERERLYQDYSDQMRMTVKPISFEAWLEERDNVERFAKELPFYNPFKKETQ